MAKARYGLTATENKCEATATSSHKKMIGMGVLVLVAGLAKLNADNHYVENFVSNYQQKHSANRNLAGQDVEDTLSESKYNLNDEILSELKQLYT